MTPTPEPDVRELAARAHWAASNGRRLRDGETPILGSVHYAHADAVLAAVTPVIRRQALLEVANHLDAVRYWDFGGTRHVRDALAITEKETTNG